MSCCRAEIFLIESGILSFWFRKTKNGLINLGTVSNFEPFIKLEIFGSGSRQGKVGFLPAEQLG